MKSIKLEDARQGMFVAGTILLFLGLVSSKALISIGSVVIILSALPEALKISRQAPVNFQVLGFVLLFIAPLISGMWSESIKDWGQVVSNKIILPALFCGVVFSIKLKPRIYYGLGILQSALVALASFYSIGPLLLQPQGITQRYLQAKTLNVLLSNDHLHFSLYVFITVVLMTFHHRHVKNLYGKKVFYLQVALQVWLIIYLHLLGAKTGLILLYGAFVYYWWNQYGRQASRPIWFAGLAGMGMVAALSVKWIPTLQNRIYYTLYDFNQYIHGAYVDGLTDGARVLSWKAAMDIAWHSPWTGIGFGDMHPVFMDWHRQHSAHLQPYNWLQPSNEWLMYLCGSGIAGMLLLTLGLWLIYSRYPYRPSMLFNILFFSQFFMMWYEVNLTNQTGIAIFAFFMGWIHHSDDFDNSR